MTISNIGLPSVLHFISRYFETSSLTQRSNIGFSLATKNMSRIIFQIMSRLLFVLTQKSILKVGSVGLYY